MSWTPPPPPRTPPLSLRDKLRAARRGVLILGALLLGLAVMIPLRLPERLIHGARRPWTPSITVLVCRVALWALGLRVTRRGRAMPHAGGFVANHVTWLDIFVLNAGAPLFFVAKSEVSGWPGIGWMARIAGTRFVKRDRREAARQAAALEEALLAGERLLFFPEGTSTDGQRVLPFKSTLFASFLTERLRHELHLQAISTVYHPPAGADPLFYGWWGDMEFGDSLLRVLAQKPQGRVTVVYHDALRVDDHPNRKTLAAHLEEQVRSGFDSHR